MSFDFYCQIISEYTELERSIEEAEKQRNKDKAREIEGKINNIYDSHSSLLYHHLTAQKRDANAFRSYWIKNKRKDMPDENFGVRIGKFASIIIPAIDPNYLSPLPKYSFAIQFKFTLAKSYISKDDKEFYILDNPVKKDWVFKVPMVSGSTWKGHLRWTMRKNEGRLDNDDNEQIVRLFGHQREKEGVEEQKKQRRGRLIFFPSFFDKIDVEVINPHNRETKAGTLPIHIEVVPEKAIATFTLLYVPFDLIGKPENKVRDEVAQDLDLIAKAIKEMMLTYGFSAKKTSGFGVVNDNIEGHLSFHHDFPVIKIEAEQSDRTSVQEEPLPGYLISKGKLKPEYLNPDGTFKEVELRVHENWNKKKQQLYYKAKNFYEKQLAQHKECEPKEEKKLQVIQSKQYPLRHLIDIKLIAQKMAEAIVPHDI